MQCPNCQELYKDGRPKNFGSDPKCAFENGTFSDNNWNCAGLINLRYVLRERVIGAIKRLSCIAVLQSDDQKYFWWEVEEISSFNIVQVFYYKDHGCTGSISFLKAENGEIKSLRPTYNMVQEAVKQLTDKIIREQKGLEW